MGSSDVMGRMKFTTIAKESNLFAILEDETDTFPFLQLPRELRDEIYERLLDRSEIHQTATYEYKSDDAVEETHDNGLTARETRPSTIRKPWGWWCDVYEQCAMLYTSKRISREFLATIRRCVPLHLTYEVEDRYTFLYHLHIVPVLPTETAAFGTGSPARALMFIECEFQESFGGQSPESFQDTIVAKDAFRDFLERLSECKHATHLILRCRLSLSNSQEVEDWKPGDGSVYDHYERCRTVYNRLCEVVESLSNVSQYGLEVIIVKSACYDYFQLGYAQRCGSGVWDSSDQTRLTVSTLSTTHPLALPCPELSKAAPEWHSLYSSLKVHPYIGGHGPFYKRSWRDNEPSKSRQQAVVSEGELDQAHEAEDGDWEVVVPKKKPKSKY